MFATLILGAEDGRGATGGGGGGEKASALRSSISMERSSRFLSSAMVVVTRENALRFGNGLRVRLKRSMKSLAQVEVYGSQIV